jgi:SAM-dependent methyltransferase
MTQAAPARRIDSRGVDRLISEIVDGFREEPIDFMGSGDVEGEGRYLFHHSFSYARTVRDILSRSAGRDRESISILEIGPFFGVVAIALAELGFEVSVVDIEEFLANERIQDRFHRHGVRFESCNLRDSSLPFPAERFDFVLMCETLEHFDFNPLPALNEIHRVLKADGLLYVTVPNQAELKQRVKLLGGESIHNPIGDFFEQMKPNSTMIVGLHWREYTASEMKEMLERIDLDVVEQRYEMGYDWPAPPMTLKRRLKRYVWRILNRPSIRRAIVRLMFDAGFDPSLQEIQITMATKPRSARGRPTESA